MVPSFLADFEIIPIPMLEARFMGGWERSPLLGEGRRGSVRLGRLGIGMISKSAKKDGTSIVHQCPCRVFFSNSKRFSFHLNVLIIAFP